MVTNKQKTEQKSPIWEFVSLDNYHRPVAPKKEATRSGLMGLWRNLIRPPLKRELGAQEVGLDSLTQQSLEEVVSIDWDEPMSALDLALHDWCYAEQPSGSVRVVVGAPYSGIGEILTGLATRKRWHIIDPPSHEQIMQASNEWLTSIRNRPEPMVIPQLERWYLRHYDGLNILRELVKLLAQGRGKYLVGCDSWAWAYLRHAIHLDSLLPCPLTLQALDDDRLGRWLQALSSKSSEHTFLFRQADNGKHVLQGQKESVKGERRNPLKDADHNGSGMSDFLKHLAAYSRGISGVALVVWRRSLQYSKDEHVEATLSEKSDVKHGTIWVKPWAKLSLPCLPRELDNRHLFTLHALLLHGGLNARSLCQLLPFSTSEIEQAIIFLRSAQLIEAEQDIWRVSELVYPPIRDLLYSEGYLVDSI